MPCWIQTALSTVQPVPKVVETYSPDRTQWTTRNLMWTLTVPPLHLLMKAHHCGIRQLVSVTWKANKLAMSSQQLLHDSAMTSAVFEPANVDQSQKWHPCLERIWHRVKAITQGSQGVHPEPSGKMVCSKIQVSLLCHSGVSLEKDWTLCLCIDYCLLICWWLRTPMNRTDQRGSVHIPQRNWARILTWFC